MAKYRNEQLNRVLMSRKSVVFKDKKHPSRQKLKQQTRSVKIAVRNAPQGVKMLLFPSDVEVTYRAPVSRIKDDAGITAVVDYNTVDFSSPSNKVKVMIGEVPAAYQDVKFSHDSVEYIIEKH